MFQGMDRNLMFDLADIVTERPYLSHEEARLEMGLSDEDFATVLQMLRKHLKAGRPLRPRPLPKPTLRDLLTYG